MGLAEMEFLKAPFAMTGAQLSDCRTYRYALWRTWDDRRPMLMWVGLNPSTADETDDDNTIRRCKQFAKDWGYGGIHMLNLFAFRATNPRDMIAQGHNAIGPENNRFLKMYADSSARIMAVWGAHGGFLGRNSKVIELLGLPWCLGMTKSGHPKHPLRLRADTKPVRMPLYDI